MKQQSNALSLSLPSLQIKQLEKELGVKLINRNNCNFSLTPAGEKFYEPCKRIVGDVQNLMQNMVSYGNESGTELYYRL